MNYVEYAFAHVPLHLKWVPMLLAELASGTQAFNLFLLECREPDDGPFRLHRLELFKVDMANPLVP